MKKKSFITLISSFLAVLFVLSSAVVGISARESEVVGSGEGSYATVKIKRDTYGAYSNIFRSVWQYEINTLLPSTETLTLAEVQAKPLKLKIDDGSTTYSIYLYRNSPSDTNCYYWSDADTIYLPANSSYLFYGLDYLNTIDLSGFDTSLVTNMNHMFSECYSLNSLNLGDKFDTLNVTDMGHMFYYCEDLTSLNLGDKYNTSNVTNMYCMFAYCSSLASLSLGDKFDTANVSYMDWMFLDCASLSSLELGDNFDTANVTTMENMFLDCASLSSLNLGNKFDTANVSDMQYMFSGCSSLETIYSDTFNTDNVTSCSYIFNGCTSLDGGNGTTYDESHKSDKSYARVDGEDGQPGYFRSLSSRPTPTPARIIETSGGSERAMVTLTTEAPTFNVTVPTILPVAVDSNNNVVTATNAKISNNGNGAVQITDCTLDTSGSDWSIVPFDTDFRTVPVDSKQYGFKLNGVEAAVNGGLYAADQFSVINGKADSDTLDYTANVAIQSSSANAVNIGTVIFTVANYTAA